MKILEVLFLHPRIPGGYEAFLTQLAKEAKKRGDHLFFLFPSPPCQEMEEVLEKTGVEYRVVPGWASGKERLKQSNKALLFYLIGLFKRERFDLVDLHFCQPGCIFLIASYLKSISRKTKVVVHIHHEIREPTSLWKRYFSRIKMVSWVVDSLVVLSGKAKDVLSLRGVPPKKLVAIPNGARDATGWLSKRTRPVPLSREEKREVSILSIASLRKIKGIEYLLLAFQKVCEEVSNCCLTIVGDGPEESNLKNLSVKLGVNRKVSFAGLRKDIFHFLNEADLFVLPSLREAFSLSVLEAMSASLPIIATRVGGLPEIIADNQNGLLVPPKDITALADAIKKLALDHQLRQKMGKESRCRFLENYTLEKMVSNHLNFYHSLFKDNL